MTLHRFAARAPSFEQPVATGASVGGPRDSNRRPTSEVLLAKTPGSVTYSWDYAIARPELRTLYEKSKELNWNARTALAWDTNVDPESELVSDAFNPIFGSDVWKKLNPK